MNYEGKKVLVLGLGESGLAMACWLARCGAQLVVADTREAPARLAQLQQAVPPALFVSGAFDAGLLEGIDFVAISPGLSPMGELAAIIPAAHERNIPLWGEIELFAQALQALRESRGYQPKVIAITGTNGKTTVTRLTGLLCQRAGWSVQVAGNISPAALDVLRSALEADALPQAWVLELSSFQLHFTGSLAPDAATVLNISQDHLDWHGDMQSYANDKARIFGANTIRVLNRDDPLVMSMASPLATVVTFGMGEPDQLDCTGLVNENGMHWLALATPGEEGERRRRKKDLPDVAVLVSRLMPSDALQIRGTHNAMNALAAMMLCRAIGLPLAPLLHGLRDYRGEPHRVEHVATIGGVAWYDDSKGTNVGATVAALNGMGSQAGAKAGAAELNAANVAGINDANAANPNAHLLLIAGGDGKGQDFTPLAEPVSRHVRAVLLIGRDGAAIGAALANCGVALHECASLEDAVTKAASLAQTGDAVLMSPACASYDMFRNYLHRAEAFVAAVRELALSRGEVVT